MMGAGHSREATLAAMFSSNNVKMQLLGGRKRVLIGRGGPGLAARNW
jgi:hypothetical protein